MRRKVQGENTAAAVRIETESGEGLEADIAPVEKSRSRRRHSTGSRPPPEPELPPLQRPRLPTAPPPGRFDHPGGFYGYGTWNSKGVKRRQRNWDIRQYGTDPSRKAARVDGYHSQGGDYRGR